MSCPAETPPPPPRGYRFVQTMMGPLMKRLGLSCREFAELASLRMDRPLTRSEAMRFRFHSLMCSVCRRLPGQFEAMRSVLRSCAVCDSQGITSSGEILDSAVKERILASLGSFGGTRREDE
ncbi:MAG: hypothetical protein WD342_20195 [Verrucomicrobiales bacterium]